MLKINISFKIKDQIFTFNETLHEGESHSFNIGEPVLAGKLFAVLTGLDDDYTGTLESDVVNFTHTRANNVLALGDRTMFLNGTVGKNLYKAFRTRTDKKTAQWQAEQVSQKLDLDFAKSIKKLSDEELAAVAYARASFREVKLVVANLHDSFLKEIDENKLPKFEKGYIIKIY